MAKLASEVKSPAGAGRKRPQLNIPISRLEVDPLNPRISDDIKGGTQIDILKVLYEEFDLEEVAYSMAANGYFDEEPIVVVPKKLPKGFSVNKFPTIEAQQIEFERLIKDEELSFVVVEGNRRTATAKLLLDGKLRNTVGVDDDFPSPATTKIAGDLSIIPAILYMNRDEVSPYLGVRHIIGTKRWQAYAIAKYIAKYIENPIFAKIPLKQRIKNIQEQIGDRSDVIRDQYISYKLLEQAQEEPEINAKPVKSKFSLVGVALGSPAIREYIGLPALRLVDLSKPTVPTDKVENLVRLFLWIFGNGRDKSPLLTDSRKISSRLAPVLASEEATRFLVKNSDSESALDTAYEMSDGEKAYVTRKLEGAAKSISVSISYAYKYKNDKDIALAIKECSEAIEALKNSIR
ncbi:hypothetical protein [Hymenobacter glaciei]